MRNLETGTIKWFDIAKGYGFIKTESREIFVHKSDIKTDNLKKVLPGTKVEFDLYETRPHCYQAKNVTLTG
jgi:CspA family cold shock protein